VAKGVLETGAGRPVAFRYAPSDRQFFATLDDVLERYKANSLEVLRILSANSIERTRLAALRVFAESLRRRGPSHD
jgi:hypothetical protein